MDAKTGGFVVEFKRRDQIEKELKELGGLREAATNAKAESQLKEKEVIAANPAEDGLTVVVVPSVKNTRKANKQPQCKRCKQDGHKNARSRQCKYNKHK
jgi:hypothetical protein